jgi:hypothetical protein
MYDTVYDPRKIFPTAHIIIHAKAMISTPRWLLRGFEAGSGRLRLVLWSKAYSGVYGLENV